MWWHDAIRITMRDMRIERRARDLTATVMPFGVGMVLLFGFALDPDHHSLSRFAPGLFWVTMVLCALLVFQRSAVTETEYGGFDALVLTGVDTTAMFVGKCLAAFAQLVLLAVVLGVVMLVAFNVTVSSLPLLGVTMLLCIGGMSAIGVSYSTLVMSHRRRSLLLSAMFIPLISPVLLAGTRVFDIALGNSMDQVDSWLSLIVAFCLAYVALGAALFVSLLEES